VNFRDGCGFDMDSLRSESDLAHLSSSESDLKIGFNFKDLPHSTAASLFCYATTSFSTSGIKFPGPDQEYHSGSECNHSFQFRMRIYMTNCKSDKAFKLSLARPKC
jgi:hypothetical protein